MTMRPLSNVLYAFYDLEICSVTFDFPCFLVSAELARIRNKLDKIHVVFVPGSNDGFRMTGFDPEENRWRFRHILVESCRLMPSVKGITNCRTREHARSIERDVALHVFPAAYNTDIFDHEGAFRASIDAFMFGNLIVEHVRGQEIPTLNASSYARGIVDDWIRDHAGGRKVVAMTLRESKSYDQARNSNLEEWAKFGRSLDPVEYLPVVVRDTGFVAMPMPDVLQGFTTFPAVSLSVDLRCAFYEASYLTLTVNNGPLMLGFLNPKIRYLAFKMATDMPKDSRIEHWSVYGYRRYGQHPLRNEFQRMVWEEDNCDVLRSAFDDMAGRIEEARRDGNLEARQERPPITFADAFDAAVTYQRVRWTETAAAILEHLFATAPTDPAVCAMLGLARGQQGRLAEAIKLMKRAIAIETGNPVYHFNLGRMYSQLRRYPEAEIALRTAAGLNPKDPATWANLAAAQRESGNVAEAHESYRKAVTLPDCDKTVLAEYARLLREQGAEDEALAVCRSYSDMIRADCDAEFDAPAKIGVAQNRPLDSSVDFADADMLEGR